MKIFVGYDTREDIAYQVCEYSIYKNSKEAEVIPLNQNNLRQNKWYWRGEDKLASTEFTFTRFLVPALAKLKLPVRAQPDGAFYLYVDISHYSENAVDFCRQLLDEQGVALTPGIDFGGPCPQSSVRLAYTVAIPRLQNAIARIEQFLKK